jgi:hypothetical protein
VCGKSFASRQALGGHVQSHNREERAATHAIATAPPQTSAFVNQLERARREIVAQFRPRIRELDREIDRAKARVVALTAERKDVEAQLRRLDPDAPKMGPKSKNKSEDDNRAAFTGNELDIAKLDATRAFLRDNGAALGPFTGQRLHHAMRDANVTPLGSSEKVRAFLPMLRDEGTIRAHKKVKGGGMAYAVVGAATNNGDVPPDAP